MSGLVPLGHHLPPRIGDLPLHLDGRLLDGGGAGLLLGVDELLRDPRGDGVEVVEHLLDVVDQPLREGAGEVLSDHHAQHCHVLRVGRHGVGRDDPPEPPQHVRHVELRVPAVVLEAECHQRNAVVLGHDVEALRFLEAFF